MNAQEFNFEHFDPFQFTATIGQLLSNSKVKEAEILVQSTVNGQYLENNHYRIKFALNLIKSIKNHQDAINNLLNRDEQVKAISLEVVKKPILAGIPEKLDSNLNDGIYINKQNNYFIKKEICPIFLSSSFNKEKIEFSGFYKTMAHIETDKLFIDSDIRISCLQSDAMTVFNKTGGYYPSRSGRVAKASLRNAYRNSGRIIPSAYILPFPHSAANFYHSLSEVGYGFRHVVRIPDNIPIIYGEDRFGIINQFANLLNINANRLLNVKDINGALIKKAFLPDTGPFYWSTAMRAFFRNIAISKYSFNEAETTSSKKVYISRLGSSRSPAYENNLVNLLKSLGFQIIQSESLNLEEQIKLFLNTDILITHHGAGLANILFCKDSVKIYEIFSDEMLAPDFYHRSKFVTASYFPVFGMNEETYQNLPDYLNLITVK